MQWVKFILLMFALIAAIPCSLGIAMRLSKLWRGGWRDILITIGLGWLSVVSASITTYALYMLAGSLWPRTPLIKPSVIAVLITCALTVPLVAVVLRKRGSSTKAGIIFALFLMAIWGTLEILDKTAGGNTSFGLVQQVDDDGTVWIRMEDGTIVGQKPIGYDQEGRIMFEQVGQIESTQK